jgi:hypothetical protein
MNVVGAVENSKSVEGSHCTIQKSYKTEKEWFFLRKK